MPPVEDDRVDEREGNDKPAGGDKGKPETITISKADYERLSRERDEAKNSERFWADKARGKNAADKEDDDEEDNTVDTSDLVPVVTGAEGVDESIFSDPEKWLAAIAKGPKAIEDLIKKQGFVNGKQVAEIAAKVARRTVDVERGKISTDTKLMEKYPELADEKSELFKATAKEYQELIKFDPEAKKSPSTLFAAAKTATAELKAAARNGGDDDEDRYDRVETERRRRVDAQDGSRSGRGARTEDREDRIGNQQRSVLEAMGLSEDKFRESRERTGRRK